MQEGPQDGLGLALPEVSAVDGPGGTYTEAATSDCPPVPGHELMGRLVTTRG